MVNVNSEKETRKNENNNYLDKWDDIWFLRFVETMNEMNEKKEAWIRLNGWAR